MQQTLGNMLKIVSRSREMDSGDVCWWEGVITAQHSRSPGPVRAALMKASPDIHPLWKCYHFNLQSPQAVTGTAFGTKINSV